MLTYGQDDRRDLFRGLHKCQSQKLGMLVSRNIQSAPIRDIFKNMFETTRMPYPAFACAPPVPRPSSLHTDLLVQGVSPAQRI